MVAEIFAEKLPYLAAAAMGFWLYILWLFAPAAPLLAASAAALRRGALWMAALAALPAALAFVQTGLWPLAVLFGFALGAALAILLRNGGAPLLIFHLPALSLLPTNTALDFWLHEPTNGPALGAGKPLIIALGGAFVLISAEMATRRAGFTPRLPWFFGGFMLLMPPLIATTLGFSSGFLGATTIPAFVLGAGLGLALALPPYSQEVPSPPPNGALVFMLAVLGALPLILLPLSLVQSPGPSLETPIRVWNLLALAAPLSLFFIAQKSAIPAPKRWMVILALTGIILTEYGFAS